MYNHCPCIARHPRPPWPPCVICCLWCSWHHHLTHRHTHTEPYQNTSSTAHGLVFVCLFFFWLEKRRYWVKVNRNLLQLKKPQALWYFWMSMINVLVLHNVMVGRHSSAEMGLSQLVHKQIACWELCSFFIKHASIVYCSKSLTVPIQIGVAFTVKYSVKRQHNRSALRPTQHYTS